jgi:S1-C subfamily serine protease
MKKIILIFLFSPIILSAQSNVTYKNETNIFKTDTSKYSIIRNVTNESGDFKTPLININIRDALVQESHVYKAVRDVSIEPISKSRGPNEVAIYDQISMGTVLIVSGENIGSGILVTNKGHIITNHHVIGSPQNISIFFKPLGDGKLKKEAAIRAELIKVNEFKDLALIKISITPSYARPISLAPTLPKVGEDAHAVGHPKGMFWTYTKGYVSAVRPQFQWQGEDNIKREATVIQTQTPINPGNSGGPLVSNRSELIGINSFIQPDAPGLNYAVSTNDLRDFLKQEGSKLSSNKSKTQTSTKNCGDEPFNKGTDKNEDGEVYFVAFDTQCKGKIDALLITPKDKNKPVRAFFDSNGDGKFDIMVVDKDHDGKWDYSLHDTNFDGKADLIGSHPDGKIVASKLSPVS